MNVGLRELDNGRAYRCIFSEEELREFYQDA
jgi:hypothetical protein